MRTQRMGSYLKILSLPSVFIACSMVFGSYYPTAGGGTAFDNVPFGSPYLYLMLVAVSALVFFALSILYRAWLPFQSNSQTSKNKKANVFANKCHAFLVKPSSWILVGMVLFLAWMLVMVAFYPGFFVYDAADQLEQYANHMISSGHPPIHTMLLGAIITGIYNMAHSYNTAIFLFLMLQTVLVACIFVRVLKVIYDDTGSLAFLSISLMVCAFFPYIVVFAQTSSKDTIFSAFVILLLAETRLLVKDPKGYLSSRRSWVRFIGSALLVLLFRKNAIFAMLVFFFVLGCVLRKEWKGLIPLALIPLFLFVLVSGPLYSLLGVASYTKAEALSIPFQQIARTYTVDPEYFEEPENQALFSYLPKETALPPNYFPAGLNHYDPELADWVKESFALDGSIASYKEFASIWARAGLTHPSLYLNAFLHQSVNLWYPSSLIDCYTGAPRFAVYEGKTSYFHIRAEEPGEFRGTLFPGIRHFYDEVGQGDLLHRMPIISTILSPGAWVWALVIVLAFSIGAGRTRDWIPLTLIVALLLTVTLGPAILLRYIAYLFFAFPFLLAAFLPQRRSVREIEDKKKRDIPNTETTSERFVNQ